MESKPDVGKVLLLPEDSLVIMASDGLWDVIEDQQAVDIALVCPNSHRSMLSWMHIAVALWVHCP